MTALSNIQKSTVSRNPHNTVVKLRPYLLDFLSYVATACGEEELKEKDELQKNAKEVFYALEPFHLEE